MFITHYAHVLLYISVCICLICGPGSSVSIATELWAGRSRIERPDWPWGPPRILYNGYRVFPRGKVRPGHAADHSPPPSAVVMEE